MILKCVGMETFLYIWLHLFVQTEEILRYDLPSSLQLARMRRSGGEQRSWEDVRLKKCPKRLSTRKPVKNAFRWLSLEDTGQVGCFSTEVSELMNPKRKTSKIGILSIKANQKNENSFSILVVIVNFGELDKIPLFLLLEFH